MPSTRLSNAILAFVLTLGLCACGNPTASTPAPPNSPQTQVLNIDKTLADAINAAVKLSITLRDQGKLSQANVTIIQSWAKSAVLLDDAIAIELASADPWPTQKAKILAMLPGLKIPTISGLDANMQTSLVAIQTIVAQIQMQVSQ